MMYYIQLLYTVTLMEACSMWNMQQTQDESSNEWDWILAYSRNLHLCINNLIIGSDKLLKIS